MDNMKPRDFTWSEAPLIDLPDDAARRLVAMVEVAESISLALRRALATVVAEGELREALREAFFSRTQAAFDSRVRGMTVAEPEEAGRGWISDLRQVAMDIFEARALPGLDQRRIEDQRSIIAAHSSLMATFAGRTKTGREAWGRLGLAPPPIRKEEPA
jgi:CRISPR system Cascade subunit CasA